MNFGASGLGEVRFEANSLSLRVRACSTPSVIAELVVRSREPEHWREEIPISPKPFQPKHLLERQNPRTPILHLATLKQQDLPSRSMGCSSHKRGWKLLLCVPNSRSYGHERQCQDRALPNPPNHIVPTLRMRQEGTDHAPALPVAQGAC